MKLLRLLLFPFSLLYGAILYVRHFLYDKEVLQQTYFGKKVIVIGNLAVGGTGKSPMVEYLLRLLSGQRQVAVLSRGYGRKTKGFLMVGANNTADAVGDEPLQIKRKFPSITVADCEDRVFGVRQLEKEHEIILLDDAFQHRAIKPGVSILLFDYPRLFVNKWLLPMGDYRDLFSRRHHADFIVVTKCPVGLSEEQKKQCKQILNLSDIPVFFSYIEYGNLKGLHTFANTQDLRQLAERKVLMVSGIARPDSFIKYLKEKYNVSDTLIYPDHHAFTIQDAHHILKRWEEIGEDAIIITTEKDAMRLQVPDILVMFDHVPAFYLPIEHVFEGKSEEDFNKQIKSLLAIS